MSTKKNKLGVIVPYRDRYLQLVKFKQRISEYLESKGIDYSIIVVEQDDAKLFNRGKLLNIGFMEALKEKCDYVVFHDVDMLPLKVDYSYCDVPTHLATDFLSEDKEFKREIFDSYFGGVTIFPVESFQIINGYSNEYWGWGFEDDDLFKRCIDRGIPFDTKSINTEGGSEIGLRFNGHDAFCVSDLSNEIGNEMSILITIDPDGVVCDTEKSYDRYTAFSIPSIDLSISYDSFRRYKFLMSDGIQKWTYIDSKLDTHRKTTVLVTIDFDRKIVNMYQDGEHIGKTKFTKNIKLSRRSKLYVGSKNDTEELFKGVITQVAVFNEVLKKGSVKCVTKNHKYSLTMPFEKYAQDYSLVHYYDMKMIKNYKVMDLAKYENDLTIKNCEIVEYGHVRESVIKVPFRKRGYFELESHPTSGYVGGVWTDVNIRYNQMRFHNEMEKGYRNPNEDGLSNLNYKVWDRTKVNKQIQLNVGI